MIVVDSNVICYLFLKNGKTALAESAIEKDPTWVCPLLWRSEIRNVLSVYVRKGLVTLSDAQAVMEQALKLMAGHEQDIDSSHVLKLAAESTCSAYDCEFVALAKDFGIPLITVDKKILSQFPDVAIALDQYVVV
ncbi:MAG: type II toxin-antitoxin system VapC family toxin [Thermoguttaceae bacterium]|jgi:predicted nucleic acid-binding protein